MKNKKRNDKFLINFNATITEAIFKIQNNKRGDLLVKKNKKIIGTLSGGDIMRSLLISKVLDASIQQIINYNFKFLKKRDLKEAKKIFINHGVSLIPVLSKNLELKSTISLNDVLKRKSD
jgi:predicted transcriptional regulator